MGDFINVVRYSITHFSKNFKIINDEKVQTYLQNRTVTRLACHHLDEILETINLKEENILGLMVLKVSIHGHVALPFLGQPWRMWWTKLLAS